MTRHLLIFAVAATYTVSTASAGGENGDYEPGELVCAVNPGGSIDSINARYGTSTIEVIYSGTAVSFSYLLAVPDGLPEDSLADAISLDPDVFYCSPNYLLDAPEPVQRSQPFLDVTGESEVQSQAAARTLQLSTVRTLGTGTSVLAAVIDVGVDANQPMLSGSVMSGIDYIDQDTIPDDPGTGPATGHGTFVAGVVKLVAPDVHIVPYRVLDTLGRGNGFSVAKAVLDAIDRGCRVINISMVMSGKHPTLDVAIEYAREHDVVVVAAAGNDSIEGPRFPADDSYCLGVAALDSADVKTPFSNYGSSIDLSAPGLNIKGPYIDTAFARWDGTSFAAPFVAGTAALLFSLRPQATWSDVVDLLEQTAVNIDAQNPTYAGRLGKGRVDPLAALSSWWSESGDVNASGVVNSADIIYLVNHVFKGGPEPVNTATGDVDASCTITSGDIIYLVNFVFKAGPAPLRGCAE